MAAAVTTTAKCSSAVIIAGRVPTAAMATVGAKAASSMTSGTIRDRTMSGVIDRLDGFLILARKWS